MNLSRLKPELQRFAAITLPVLGVLLAGFLVVPKVMEIGALGRELTVRRQEAVLRRQQNAQELARLSAQRLPARPESKGEQLAFLKELGRLVATSHVRLMSYRPPAAEGGVKPVNPPGVGGAPLKPIATEVTVCGSFHDLVTLFQGLASAERLFTVEDVQVRADGYPRLSAAFRLVRYVVPVRMTMALGDLRS